jgi:hypothetical protein
VGLHYDLHAREDDTELGLRADPAELAAAIQLMGPDWVQTDCKGHPGYTSWFSTVEGASVPPKLAKDALAQWREATDSLKLPLHCHYSGIMDAAAARKHPEWAVTTGESDDEGVICPRSSYVDSLMIPQLLELIDRYHVNGFWVDGEVWAVRPCYCSRCLAAWHDETGMDVAPRDPAHIDWPKWMDFTRRGFEAYVTKYAQAVHKHKRGVLVCSNWLQTFRNPGAPTVPTDWISGDNTSVFGLDRSRCEARFLSTRGKHWDIMLWAFYSSVGHGRPESPPAFKPAQMLMQEAAVHVAFGGHVQMYEHPPVRDGRLVPNRQKVLGRVVEFIKRRKEYCQGTETHPQIAVLHSEHHLYATVNGPNLLWNVDTAPVEGAVFALLENHFGVDVLDEWALRPRIGAFPMVVVPEQSRMSEDMVKDLLSYVGSGGRLLITGSGCYERLGPDVLGATSERVESETTYTARYADVDCPIYSRHWRLLAPTTAEVVDVVAKGCFFDDTTTSYPVAITQAYGDGTILYIPADIFRDFQRNRYPQTRELVGCFVNRLAGRMDVRVTAPPSIDVALRTRGNETIVHLLNRGSGIPQQPNNGAVDYIPTVGPISVTMRRESWPTDVSAVFEGATLTWDFVGGELTINVSQVHIHEAVVIE